MFLSYFSLFSVFTTEYKLTTGKTDETRIEINNVLIIMYAKLYKVKNLSKQIGR